MGNDKIIKEWKYARSFCWYDVILFDGRELRIPDCDMNHDKLNGEEIEQMLIKYIYENHEKNSHSQ